jgi:alpha-tubulin suppressor-like RCC1 family protein
MTPVPVSGLTNVTAMAGGGLHSLALLSDGTVMAWGYNGYGQLGDGTFDTRTAPVPVSGLVDVTALAGGDFHNLALLLDGTLMAWGYNNSGQLGNGTLD